MPETGFRTLQHQIEYHLALQLIEHTLKEIGQETLQFLAEFKKFELSKDEQVKNSKFTLLKEF